MEVLNKFKKVFEIDDQYLIINGGVCAGKFYAACQKVIAISICNSTCSLIVAENRHEMKVIIEIIGNVPYKLNKSNNIISFSNGSVIYVHFGNQMNGVGKFDYIIVQGADYFPQDAFEVLDRRRSKQIILTCNPPQDKIIDGKIIKHWMNVLKEREDCYLLNVGHAGNPYMGEEFNKQLKTFENGINKS